MTPIVVRLCECLHLNPVPIFPIIVLHANIAGLSTLIGHPPNLIITGNPYVNKVGVTFLTYSMHMIIGVVIALIQTHVQIRLVYGDIASKLAIQQPATDKENAATIKLAIWERSYAQLPMSQTREEHMLHALIEAKLQELKGDVLKQSEKEDIFDDTCVAPELFDETLTRLRKLVSFIYIYIEEVSHSKSQF